MKEDVLKDRARDILQYFIFWKLLKIQIYKCGKKK
jgi:hypothetical protein